MCWHHTANPNQILVVQNESSDLSRKGRVKFRKCACVPWYRKYFRVSLLPKHIQTRVSVICKDEQSAVLDVGVRATFRTESDRAGFLTTGKIGRSKGQTDVLYPFEDKEVQKIIEGVVRGETCHFARKYDLSSLEECVDDINGNDKDRHLSKRLTEQLKPVGITVDYVELRIISKSHSKHYQEAVSQTTEGAAEGIGGEHTAGEHTAGEGTTAEGTAGERTEKGTEKGTENSTEKSTEKETLKARSPK